MMRRFKNRLKQDLKNKKFKKAFDDEDNKSFSLNTLAKLAQAFDKKLKVGFVWSIMRIQVKVVPRAKKREVRQLADGTWRVAVAAPAEGGRANAELIEALAKHFDVPKGSLQIVRGQTSRLKQIEIPRSCY